MANSNSSVGILGKIVLFLIAFILGMIAPFAAVFCIAYFMKLNKVSDMLSGVTGDMAIISDENGILSEAYGEKTLWELFMDAGSLISGDMSIEDLCDISPMLGTKINDLVTTVNSTGYITLDANDLKSLTLSGDALQGYVQGLVQSIQLEGFLIDKTADGFNYNDIQPIIKTLLYGSDYEISADGKTITCYKTVDGVRTVSTPTNVGMLMNDMDSFMNSIELASLLGGVDPNNGLMVVVLYGGFDFGMLNENRVCEGGKLYAAQSGDTWYLHTKDNAAISGVTDSQGYYLINKSVGSGTPVSSRVTLRDLSRFKYVLASGASADDKYLTNVNGTVGAITDAVKYAKVDDEYVVSAAGEYVAKKIVATSVGNVADRISNITDDITIGSVLEITDDSPAILKKLENKTIAEMSNIFDELYIIDVLDNLDASNALMMYLGYGKWDVAKLTGTDTVVSDNGKLFTQQDATDNKYYIKNSDTADDFYLVGGERITLDDLTLYGYNKVAAGTGTHNKVDGEFVAASSGNYTYGEKAPTGINTVSEIIDGFQTDLKVSDIIDIDPDDKLMSKLGDYTISTISNVVDDLYITDILDNMDGSNALMMYLGYGKWEVAKLTDTDTVVSDNGKLFAQQDATDNKYYIKNSDTADDFYLVGGERITLDDLTLYGYNKVDAGTGTHNKVDGEFVAASSGNYTYGEKVPTGINTVSEIIDGFQTDLKVSDIIDIDPDDKLMSKLGDYTISTISNVVDDLYITDILDDMDASNALMMYLGYGKWEVAKLTDTDTVVSDNGKLFTQQDATDNKYYIKNSDTADDFYLVGGERITLDDLTLYGYNKVDAGTGTHNKVDGEFVLASSGNYTYGEKVPTGINTVSEIIDGFQTDLKVSDIIDIDPDDKLMNKIGDYTISTISSVVDELYIVDVMDVNPEDSLMMYLGYGKIYEAKLAGTDTVVSADGSFFAQKDATDDKYYIKNSDAADDFYLVGGVAGARVTLDDLDLYGYSLATTAGTGTHNKVDGEYVTAANGDYVYGIITPTVATKVGDKVENMKDEIKISDIVPIDEDDKLMNKIGDYTINTIGDVVDDLTLVDVMAIDPENKLMMYIAYGKIYEAKLAGSNTVVSANGSFFAQKDAADDNYYIKNSDAADDFYLVDGVAGARVTLDDLDLYGYTLAATAGTGTHNRVDGEYVTAANGDYVYGVLTPTVATKVGEKVDTLKDDLTVSDIIDIDPDDKVMAKLGGYTINNIGNAVDELYITDVMDVNPEDSLMMYLGYGKVYEAKLAGTVTIVSANGSFFAQKDATDDKYYIKNSDAADDFYLVDGVAGARITLDDLDLFGYILAETAGTGTHNKVDGEYVTAANGDYVYGILTPTLATKVADKINTLKDDLKVSDIIDIDPDDKVMAKLGGYTINNISNAIDELYITDVMDVNPEDSLMMYLGYGKIYEAKLAGTDTVVSANGSFFAQLDGTDNKYYIKNSDAADDFYLVGGVAGARITLDDLDLFGYILAEPAGTGTHNKVGGEYVLAANGTYVYGVLTPTLATQVSSKVDTLKDDLKVSDIIDIDPNDKVMSKIGGYTINNIGSAVDELYLTDVMDVNPEDSLMTYIAYGKIYEAKLAGTDTVVSANGSFFAQLDGTDNKYYIKNSDAAGDFYLNGGERITLDDLDLYGYLLAETAGTGTHNKVDGEYVSAVNGDYVYGVLTPTLATQVADKTNTLKDDLKVSDIINIDPNDKVMSKIGGYTINNIGSAVDELYLTDVMDVNPEDSLMTYIAYGKIYEAKLAGTDTVVSADGSFFAQQDATDNKYYIKNSATADDFYLVDGVAGARVTLDDLDLYGYTKVSAGTGTHNKIDGEYVLASGGEYVYGVLTPTLATQVADKTNTLKDDLKVSDIIDIDPNDRIMSKMGDYTINNIGTAIDNLYVSDVIDVDPDMAIMMYMAYGRWDVAMYNGDIVSYEKGSIHYGQDTDNPSDTINYIRSADDSQFLTYADADGTHYVTVDMLTFYKASDNLSATGAYNYDGTTYSVASGNDGNTDLALIEATRAIDMGDKMDTAMDDLTLGEIIEINSATSAPILVALKDTPVNQIGSTINTIEMCDIITINPSDKILSAIAHSTLETVSSDLQNLTLQQLFASDIYSYTQTHIYVEGYTYYTQSGSAYSVANTSGFIDGQALADGYYTKGEMIKAEVYVDADIYFTRTDDDGDGVYDYTKVTSALTQTNIDDGEYYTRGTASGIWRYMVYDKTIKQNYGIDKEALYTISEIGNTMDNVSYNISNATLLQLYQDGIISANPGSLGSYTIDGLITFASSMGG